VTVRPRRPRDGAPEQQRQPGNDERLDEHVFAG
jgi:hypothetical protein